MDVHMSGSKHSTIQALFLRNRRRLLTFLARKVGRDAAPDLLQETFLRILRYDKLGEVADPEAFLQVTASNLSRDYSRRQATETKYLLPGEDGAGQGASEASPEEIAAARERTRRLLEAVNALPPKCRQVFIMRRFDDLSQQEIAARLGISRNMVEKHLRLALERCRAALEED
jgi:RNA polymerase sigma-70 factor (ECF subfamily)